MGDSLRVKSILYVEDEKNIQHELADVLNDYCDVLYTADNGEEGFEAYKTHKPTIVVSDIKMPKLNGIDMVKQIKELSDNNSRIVFTTAFSDYDYLHDAIELQVDGYILKPIMLDKLEDKLESIIKDIKNKENLQERELMLIQQSKLASMGEMISNIAHQWRQPLATISSTSMDVNMKTLMGKSIEEKDLLECSQIVESQVQYLSQTIDDFRNFFNPNSNNTDKFKISEFVNRCTNLVKASFQNSSIELITQIDDNIEINSDQNQLSQAIINILNNARDALNDVKDTQPKLVFMVSVRKTDDGYSEIIIADNGGGIPDEIIERVFEPYFSTKFKTNGTGLGLYITHNIITKYLKGSIKVVNDNFEHEGKLYKGAKFIIKVPDKK